MSSTLFTPYLHHSLLVVLANLLIAATIIAYPLVIYFGLDIFDARLIAFVLIVMALARLFFAKRFNGPAAFIPQTNLVIIALLVIGISALASNSPVFLLYYPVCMNVLMFMLFATSLLRPPSIIEQIARLKTPDLPNAAIAYTRKVTIVWCVFFAANGAMALYTILATSMEFWALYNSLISYSLMGLLFAGEYAIRRNVKRCAARQQDAKECL
jgi:uncharacterized membrane protein